ncbi:MAG: FMN-binding glutamate synthase family protein [Chitinophagaceae bacterium]|nr:MAG: FMN-binding glutamate synthase family protein [Chitinophagaceae bacterium]
MKPFEKRISLAGSIVATLVFVNIIVVSLGYSRSSDLYLLLLITMPLLIMALQDVSQKKHAIRRNYPVLGRLRYLFESIRPEMRQYFFESDLDGKPFNRRQRSIVYQRAKNQKQTVAFGMQADPLQPGYEWVAHSMYPVKMKDKDLRTWIGNDQCLQPYSASIFNISAMSYGALSKTAVQSLNEGAKLGGFAHNTGEGGISSHHLKGGDLIWQIGTGYFGCRDVDGNFSEENFEANALRPEVKMIELKLSQGAKPGHGGILPAAKNTPEIAAIRLVEPGVTVHSPGAHSAFSTPEGLMFFLQKMRRLSKGKPVGFKICIGNRGEFTDVCKAMISSGIVPDFISVDGAEGGTGAAPLEFTDHLGMPLFDALAFVKATLVEFGLQDKVKIIAAGKIITAFDVLKSIALGASACYSARGMMLSLGCIQALVCDSGRCPVGVTTQDPRLYKGIDPADKRVRVANYHRNTIDSVKEIMEACGFSSLEKIDANKFYRRLSAHEYQSLESLYNRDAAKTILQTQLN